MNVSYCSLLLQIEIITATVKDSRHYSNDLLQDGLKDRLLHFLYVAIPLAEVCALITKLLAYHFSLNTASNSI